MMDVSEWTRGRRVNRGVFILLRMRRERGLGAGNNVNSELSALRRRGTRLQVLVQQLLPHVKLSTAVCREPQPHQQSESDEAAALTNSPPLP